MGKSAPSAPDPYQSAGAQYKYGTQAAAYNKALNATNTVGPTGTTSNQITGYDPNTGAPMYTQTTQLTGPEQALLTGQQQGGLGEQAAAGTALGELSGISGQPLYGGFGAPSLQTSLDTSNVPGLPSTAATGGIQDQATQAVQKQINAQLDPQWNNQEEQLKAQLVNSGNGPGTPAYENAMSAFNAQKTAAYTQGAGEAATAGAQVGQTQFGEAATANQQTYGEDLNTLVAQNQAKGMSQQDAIAAANAQISQRSSLANLVNGLFGGASVNIPTASGLPTSSAGTPDIMSAFQNAYSGQLAQYNANVGTEDSAIGTIGMLGALAMFSDERMKDDIERVGTSHAGLPMYMFHYRGEPPGTEKHLGMMAHEVERVFPHAVGRHPSGFKTVDYSQVS